MLLLDVNVCVYAIRKDIPGHGGFHAWVDDALNGDEPVGVSDLVLSGVIRIITNHRIFEQPSTTQQALDACQALRSSPVAVSLQPGKRHWEIFEALCRETSAKGNAVPDAYHAALAIENGATWITTDRGFARFTGLRWRHPLC